MTTVNEMLLVTCSSSILVLEFQREGAGEGEMCQCALPPSCLRVERVFFYLFFSLFFEAFLFFSFLFIGMSF